MCSLLTEEGTSALDALSRQPLSDEAVARLAAGVAEAPEPANVLDVLGRSRQPKALDALYAWFSDPAAPLEIRAAAVEALVTGDTERMVSGGFREGIAQTLVGIQLPVRLRGRTLRAFARYGSAASDVLLAVAQQKYEQVSLRTEALRLLRLEPGSAAEPEQRRALLALVQAEPERTLVREAALLAQTQGTGGMQLGDPAYLALLDSTGNKRLKRHLVALIDDHVHRKLPGVAEAIEAYRAAYPED